MCLSLVNQTYFIVVLLNLCSSDHYAVSVNCECVQSSKTTTVASRNAVKCYKRSGEDVARVTQFFGYYN